MKCLETLNFCKFLSVWLEQMEAGDSPFVSEDGFMAPENLLALEKPDLRHRLVWSLVQTSQEFSERCINPHSLLPEQLDLFGMQQTSSSKTNFALMNGWAVRPLILPCKPTKQNQRTSRQPTSRCIPVEQKHPNKNSNPVNKVSGGTTNTRGNIKKQA